MEQSDPATHLGSSRRFILIRPMSASGVTNSPFASAENVRCAPPSTLAQTMTFLSGVRRECLCRAGRWLKLGSTKQAYNIFRKDFPRLYRNVDRNILLSAMSGILSCSSISISGMVHKLCDRAFV